MQSSLPRWEVALTQAVLRGTGASRAVGPRLRELVGGRNVALIADTAVHELGLTSGCVASLEAAGFAVHVVLCAPGEPDVAAVERAAEDARAANADAVVGIGGGSALDTAKLVARASVGAVAVADLVGPLERVAHVPPLVLIPTTVGTGSEVTTVAMYAVQGRKVAVISPQFIPVLVVLDTDLVVGLPASVIASTALDALAHGVESWQSSRGNELTRTFAARAVGLIFQRLRPACSGDGQAIADLQFASFLAGLSLNAGVVLGHSLSYAMAERHPMAHGVGCAIALPYCLAYNQAAAVPDLDVLTEAALGRSGTWRDLAVAVQELAAEVELPTSLRGYPSSPDESRAIAARVMEAYPRPNNPIPLELDRLTTLVDHVRRGDLGASWQAMGAPA